MVDEAPRRPQYPYILFSHGSADQGGEGLEPKVKEALLQLMNPADETPAPRYLPL